MKALVVKLHWAERFMNYMVHHTDLYQRKKKNCPGGIVADKRLFDQLVPFFEELKKEAYLEGYSDATKGDDPKYDDELES